MDIQGRMENNSQAVLWDSEILYEYSDIWYGSCISLFSYMVTGRNELLSVTDP